MTKAAPAMLIALNKLSKWDCPVNSAESAPRRSRRPKRRQLFCPLHGEHILQSVSAKHMLYITDTGPLVLSGMGKRRATELLAAYHNVLTIGNEWLENFWCEGCQESRWWHVIRHDRVVHELKPISREIWERASGVIRPEGNPTIGEFTRRNARACGKLGMQQFRFV